MRLLPLVLLAALGQAQAPPPTEIYLAPLSVQGTTLTVGPFTNISNSPGYDNQPSFTRDGSAILFASVRNRVVSAPVEGAAPPGQQTDIFRYDVAARRVSQVTDTLESEYSPTETPDGAGISVIRVEADGTQRLWRFGMDGRSPALVLERVKPVGYHAWIDGSRLALFILGAQGQPATLQVADVRTGTAEVVATDIGRSVLRIPGAAPHVSFVHRERKPDGTAAVAIKRYAADAAGEARITTIAMPVTGAGQPDVAWMPDGTLLMAHEGKLHRWRDGGSGWEVVADLAAAGLEGATRLAVSPKGDALAIVAGGR